MKIKIEDIISLPEVQLIKTMGIEYLLYIYVLPSGKFEIVTVKGNATQIQCLPATDVAKKYKKIGAKGLFTIHNHPLEIANPSIRDIHVHLYFESKYKELGVNHIDDLIIDYKGNYCTFRELFDTL